jgi:hypothetical protein
MASPPKKSPSALTQTIHFTYTRSCTLRQGESSISSRFSPNAGISLRGLSETRRASAPPALNVEPRSVYVPADWPAKPSRALRTPPFLPAQLDGAHRSPYMWNRAWYRPPQLVRSPIPPTLPQTALHADPPTVSGCRLSYPRCPPRGPAVPQVQMRTTCGSATRRAVQRPIITV